MRVILSRQVYDQITDKNSVTVIACDCVTAGKADADCALCDGEGELYEMKVSETNRAAIENNLRSQGVPLGKEGTH